MAKSVSRNCVTPTGSLGFWPSPIQQELVMTKGNNKVLKSLGIAAAIVIALLAVLTYTGDRIESVDKRLTASVTSAAEIERYHYGEVMAKLMEQGQDIGEIKGVLGRIEKKLK